MHGDAKWQRLIPLVAQLLLPHDVLALQEVWAFRKQLLSMLHAAGFAHMVLPAPAARGTLIDSGLVIASRFPVTEVRRLSFRDDGGGCTPSGPDRHASKGALHAAVTAPNGKRYHVFNTHMQATYSRQPSAAEAATLRCQLGALMRFVQDAAAPAGGVLPTMRAAGFQDVLPAADATPTVHIVYGADGKELSTVTRMCAKCAARYASHPLVAMRVDHLWVRGLAVHSARVVPTEGASDHDGVLAEVH
jgi:endonuclease/exonuclease/phosphatase family metal-dependent hydrolase